MDTVITKSMITCPVCGFQKKEVMPGDACQYFYQCTNCRSILKPKQGDCCVFCSYGSIKCPSKQSCHSVNPECQHTKAHTFASPQVLLQKLT